MLTKLKRLIHRSTQIQAGCLAALQNIASQDDCLERKEKNIDEQLRNLSLLEALDELLNQVVLKDRIFTVLRKVAVVRHKKTQLELEKQEIHEKRKSLALERETQLAHRKVWWLKEQKYEQLRKRVLSEMLRNHFFAEEMEQEENYRETCEYDK